MSKIAVVGIEVGIPILCRYAKNPIQTGYKDTRITKLAHYTHHILILYQ